MSSNLSKKEWRAIARSLIAEHAPSKSLEHVHYALNSQEFLSAEIIALYFSVPTEPCTAPIIEAAFAAGKRVVVPVCDMSSGLYDWREYILGAELVEARFGIVEPNGAEKIDPKTIDVCFLPGLLFDKKGIRLGHGGGFYDRLLAQLNSATPIIGLAYPWQIVDELPAEQHDMVCTKVIY